MPLDSHRCKRLTVSSRPKRLDDPPSESEVDDDSREVITGIDRLRIALAFHPHGDRGIDESPCVMYQLAGERTLEVCGRCVLARVDASFTATIFCVSPDPVSRRFVSDGVVESGPFRSGVPFKMSDASALTVAVRRTDFLKRLDDTFGDRVPPSKRRILGHGEYPRPSFSGGGVYRG